MGGLTAGNSRAARIARFIKSQDNDRVAGMRVVAREGDERLTLATYVGAQLVPQLAADVDGLIVDHATSSGNRCKGYLVTFDSADVDQATQPWEARPDKNALDAGEPEEFDGSSRSVAVELQRHLEANKRMEVAERAQQNEAYAHVIELMTNVVEKQADMMERVARRLIESENREDQARGELQQLQDDILQSAAEVDENEAGVANAEQVGTLLMKIVGSKMQQGKQSSSSGPAQAAAPDEGGA